MNVDMDADFRIMNVDFRIMNADSDIHMGTVISYSLL